MFSIEPRIKRQWYVVFDYTSKKRWYHRWLKPGFYHCYLMQKTEAGYFWIVINPVWSHVEVDYRATKTFETPREYAGEQAVIVAWEKYVDPHQVCTQLNILQCTDIVKRFLGIRRWAIFTPYQLYKYLMANKGIRCE